MQTFWRQLVITDIDPESGWQLGHPVVVPAPALSSGTLGHQGLAPAQETCGLSDLAQYVTYMSYVASGASASVSAWHVLEKR